MAAIVDGLAHGLGFALVLAALGSLREIIGSGTLFAGASLLFGPRFPDNGIVIGDYGFLLALLPPGAFRGLAMLIALRNFLQQRIREPNESPSTEQQATGL